MKKIQNWEKTEMSNLIAKDNRFLEASHKLNEVEQRLILLAIIKGREFCDSVEQLRGKELTIHADDYMKAFDVERQPAYRALKSAVLGLYRAEWGYKYVNDKGNTVVSYERFTQSAKYVENEGTVKFMFADACVPMLVELERNFTTYEIEQVANLKSRYSMRFYELLMRFKGTGVLKISYEELRFRFGLLEHEYATMSNFKQFVLDTAIKQINGNTDITVKYEQHKRGRVIIGFTFKFKYKSAPKEAPKQLDQRDPDTADMFTQYTDAQLARAVHSVKFMQDYAHLVSAGNAANQNSGNWISHMVQWLKKDPAKFNKRPLKEYLDDQQSPRF